MGRWDPNAGGRLQQAAMALYLERGYDDVTTAEIAERAGLKKRSFFRYFADKREVLFAGAEAFQAHVVAAVADADADVSPIDAVVAALAAGGAQLAQYGEFARGRRDLIASSADLQERELIKMASLTAAVAEALRHRRVDALRATLTAQAGVAAFTTAYERWIDEDGASDFPALVHQSLDELRRAICAA
jgi:AcrR family transcriptional regulator